MIYYILSTSSSFGLSECIVVFNGENNIVYAHAIVDTKLIGSILLNPNTFYSILNTNGDLKISDWIGSRNTVVFDNTLREAIARRFIDYYQPNYIDVNFYSLLSLKDAVGVLMVSKTKHEHAHTHTNSKYGLTKIKTIDVNNIINDYSDYDLLEDVSSRFNTTNNRLDRSIGAMRKLVEYSECLQNGTGYQPMMGSFSRLTTNYQYSNIHTHELHNDYLFSFRINFRYFKIRKGMRKAVYDYVKTMNNEVYMYVVSD